MLRRTTRVSVEPVGAGGNSPTEGVLLAQNAERDSTAAEPCRRSLLVNSESDSAFLLGLYCQRPRSSPADCVAMLWVMGPVTEQGYLVFGRITGRYSSTERCYWTAEHIPIIRVPYTRMIAHIRSPKE